MSGCPLCFEKSIPQCLGPSPLTIWKLLRNVCMTCAETHSGHGCFLKSFVPPRLISTRNAKCLGFVCWGLQWCRQAVRGICFLGFAWRHTAGRHVVADSVEVRSVEVDILTWRARRNVTQVHRIYFTYPSGKVSIDNVQVWIVTWKMIGWTFCLLHSKQAS